MGDGGLLSCRVVVSFPVSDPVARGSGGLFPTQKDMQNKTVMVKKRRGGIGHVSIGCLQVWAVSERSGSFVPNACICMHMLAFACTCLHMLAYACIRMHMMHHTQP